MQLHVENLSRPLRVLAVSPGLAVGPVRVLQPEFLPVESETRRLTPDQVAVEQTRLQAALDQAEAELVQLQARVATTVGEAEATIFEAHRLMLSDPDLLSETQTLLQKELLPAAVAFRQAVEQQAELLEALDNPALAARAADLRDAANRVLRRLGNAPESPDLPQADTPVILVAHDLTPSDTAKLNPAAVLGICTVVGGPTTHAGILARALEIPAVAGLEADVLERLQNGQEIALDGTSGTLYLQPNAEQSTQFVQAMQTRHAELANRQQAQGRWRTQAATTADGLAVPVYANVGEPAGALEAAKRGAEGIGLLRTEFLFNHRATFPNEQEQFESYLAVFEAFAQNSSFSKTIVARTLDAGADKPLPALDALTGSRQEANPALGVRGVRVHLLHEDLLRKQLRALLRAAAAAKIELHIMFPMIATLGEVRWVKAIYQAVWQELNLSLAVAPKIGVMIETPAAALLADLLAREIDFVSIGANDLYQYTLAADRTNSKVMSMFGRVEPAVWRSVNQVVQAVRAAGKHVAVCGELAADPQIGPLLVGLGVHELSMSPPAIERVKAALHRHDLAFWQAQAARLLAAETAGEMEAVLSEESA